MILPTVTLNAGECTQAHLLEVVKDAILYAHRYAEDFSITTTYVKDVTEALQAFIRDLKSQIATINVEAYADEALNTSSALDAGKAYWNIRFTDPQSGEQTIYRTEVTSEWVPEVLSLNEAVL